jgi:hypothetical protein
MSHIAASWALAQTVDGALKLSRDAAIAASDDNVQAIALLACERFGATLAISTLTRTKIEAMIRQQATKPFQKFLLAKIGYSKGGSIDVLSKSAEGIRFLSFASALISTHNNFDAATALGNMVRDTAEDKELSPTVYQLKDLLDVLEPRLNRARFLDEVAGFQSLLFQVTNQAVAPNIAVPSPEAIYELVKSFRELSRLGDEDTRSLKITVGPFAAWVSAFARWSVEVPPRIHYETEDVAIIDQPDSKVTICISKDFEHEKNIEIETIYAYHSIHKVVNAIVGSESKPALATGMVSLETHASLTLRELRLNDDLGLRTLKQVLPYALHLIRSKSVAKFEFHNSKSSTVSMLRSLNPFPDDEAVAAVMGRYLGEDRKASLQPLEEGCKLGDLPLVRLWIEQHRSFLEMEPAEEFYRLLSHVVLDIVALSLIMAEDHHTIQGNDILLLYTPNRTLSPSFGFVSPWINYVQRMFRDHELQIGEQLVQVGPSGHTDYVINWALGLVGHNVGYNVAGPDWVASSFRGQVLLPSILLANEIPSTGFACLSRFTGSLMLETQRNRSFSRILSKGSSFTRTELEVATGISARLNAFPKEVINWELSSKSEHLELSMGWSFNRNNQRPFTIIRALMGSVMMARCSHSMDVELSVQEHPALLPPGSNRLFEGNRIKDTQIAVYPLYGSDELKLLALASIMDMRPQRPSRKPLALINRGACINCVLGVCLLIECGYAIL